MSEKEIASALKYSLVTPNEGDRNSEPANVTDGLYAIARALGLYSEMAPWDVIASALDNVAATIGDLADATREKNRKDRP